ncbi:hypothetical protein ACHWQZ_G000011 [Mnemiopsis leidyi]
MRGLGKVCCDHDTQVLNYSRGIENVSTRDLNLAEVKQKAESSPEGGRRQSLAREEPQGIAKAGPRGSVWKFGFLGNRRRQRNTVKVC